MTSWLMKKSALNPSPELRPVVGDEPDGLGHRVGEHGDAGFPAHLAEPRPGRLGGVVAGERDVYVVGPRREGMCHTVPIPRPGQWELAAESVGGDGLAWRRESGGWCGAIAQMSPRRHAAQHNELRTNPWRHDA